MAEAPDGGMTATGGPICEETCMGNDKALTPGDPLSTGVVPCLIGKLASKKNSSTPAMVNPTVCGGGIEEGNPKGA